jgi:glycine betaine catabolism B
MAAMTFKSRLLEKIGRGPGTASYRFSRPSEYSFTAGQWFTITIASAEGPLDHHFSHADSPTESFIELTTRLTGSPFKSALDALEPGAEVEIMGPYGSFMLDYANPKIAFLTGGIGITPVRSMFRYLADTGSRGRSQNQHLVIFYGSMTEDGIAYLDEFNAFERDVPRLRIVHVITNPSADWKGYSGFITADIVRAELDDPSAWTYYIVGPPPMITAMQKVMDELAIPRKQQVIESFQGYTQPLG